MTREINVFRSDFDRVDAYVNGRMSDEQEQQFEEQYLENPELQDAVAVALRLKQGLNQSTDQGELSLPIATNINWWRGIWQYLAVPQMAWGVAAGLFLIIPLNMMLIPNSTEVSLPVAVYQIASVKTRGNTSPIEEHKIQLNSRDNNLLVIEGPPSLGMPKSYYLTIDGDSGKHSWQSKPQYSDISGKVYFVLVNNFWREERYSFELKSELTNEVVSRGVIDAY